MVKVVRTPDIYKQAFRDEDTHPRWMLGIVRSTTPYKESKRKRLAAKRRKQRQKQRDEDKVQEYAPPPPIEVMDIGEDLF